MNRKQSSTSKDGGSIDYSVRWQTIAKFFDPPLARSTFYDFVTKGKIIPLKGVRGYFRLNASLVRLGLPAVASIPRSTMKLANAELIRLAFWLIDDLVCAAPSWEGENDVLDNFDESYVAYIVRLHDEELHHLDCQPLKVAYLQGVLDAAVLEEEEHGFVHFTDPISGKARTRSSP